MRNQLLDGAAARVQIQHIQPPSRHFLARARKLHLIRQRQATVDIDVLVRHFPPRLEHHAVKAFHNTRRAVLPNLKLAAHRQLGRALVNHAPQLVVPNTGAAVQIHIARHHVFQVAILGYLKRRPVALELIDFILGHHRRPPPVIPVIHRFFAKMVSQRLAAVFHARFPAHRAALAFDEGKFPFQPGKVFLIAAFAFRCFSGFGHIFPAAPRIFACLTFRRLAPRGGCGRRGSLFQAARSLRRRQHLGILGGVIRQMLPAQRRQRIDKLPTVGQRIGNIVARRPHARLRRAHKRHLAALRRQPLGNTQHRCHARLRVFIQIRLAFRIHPRLAFGGSQLFPLRIAVRPQNHAPVLHRRPIRLVPVARAAVPSNHCIAQLRRIRRVFALFAFHHQHRARRVGRQRVQTVQRAQTLPAAPAPHFFVRVQVFAKGVGQVDFRAVRLDKPRHRAEHLPRRIAEHRSKHRLCPLALAERMAEIHGF